MGLIIHLTMWPLLIVVRTHYWIDLLSGLIIAHWCTMMGEQLSFIFDVKLGGFDAKGRK